MEKLRKIVNILEEELLNEKSLNSLSLQDEEDIIKKILAKNQNLSKKDIPSLRKKIKKKIDFYKREIIKNGKIKLYREMTVDDLFFDNLLKRNPRLGIYWSYSPEKAYSYWGFRDDPYIIMIESEIDEKYVNWEDTLVANLKPVLGEKEAEIRLFKRTPIKIKKIIIKEVLEKGKYFDKTQTINEKHLIFKKIFSKIYYA